MVAISSAARRIARAIGSLAGWLLLLFAIAAMLLFAIGPHTGRYRTLTVLSGSMSGTFEAGDVIITRPVPLDSIKVGDVITYTIPVDDHRVVTHRIVTISGPRASPIVVTKGDANPVHDPWQAQLQGSTAWRMQTHIPKAGYVLQTMHGRWVQRSSLVALAVFTLLSLVRIWTSDDPRRSSVDDPDLDARDGSDELDVPDDTSEHAA